ncbi:MAG: phosphatase PAP2 family protein [Thermococci archaeon]|nr:phosphatase PAP2 family protein [Thermococci archaeon]
MNINLGKGTVVLTVATAALLLAQLAGGFTGLNSWVNDRLPVIDSGLMNALTALGGDAFLVPAITLFVILDLRRGRLSGETLALLIATAVGLALVAVMKVSFAEPRPRPLPGANLLSSGSFPSGHAFRAAVIASYVSDRWRKLTPLAWTYAAGIAITRLLLHYHWFSDVLFSLVFAPWLYLTIRGTLPESTGVRS